MTEQELLVLAVMVFGLMCLGLILTIKEFKDMERGRDSDKKQ